MKIYTQKNTIFFVFFFFISFFGSFSLVKPAETINYYSFIPTNNSNYTNSSAYYNPADFSGQSYPQISEDTPCVDLKSDLRIGTRDYTIFGPITKLQMFLYKNEYMIYPPTGLFIYYTFDGVRNFQRDNGLMETGVVDRNTRAALKIASCPVKSNPIVVTPPPASYYCSLNNISYSSLAELNSKCVSSPNDPKTIYIINYDGNGSDSGAPTKTSETVIRGSSISLPDEGTLFKNGHIFYGWSTSPSGSNPLLTGSSYTPVSNTTLYAVWDKDNSSTYTVEYDGNGADSGSPSINSQTVNIGSSVNLASQGTLVKSGYTFKGWSEYSSGVPLLLANSSYTPTSDISLYAIWDGGNNNGGGSNNRINNVIRLSQAYQGLYLYSDFPTNSDVVVGYNYDACIPGNNQCETLYGQSTIYKGTSKSSLILSGNPNKPEINDFSLSINNISPSSDTQYVYMCETGTQNCNFSSTYTINYNSNNADSGTPSSVSQSVGIGGSVALAAQNTLTRNGYAFGGWSTSPSGTNPLSAGANYIPSSNMTLYAVWTPLTNPSNKLSIINIDSTGSFYISATLPVTSDITITYNYVSCYKVVTCSTKTGYTNILSGNIKSGNINSGNSAFNPVTFKNQTITNVVPNNDSNYSYTY